MSVYSKRVLQARTKITELNNTQKKELAKLYEDLSKNIINEIVQWPDSRTKTHLKEMYQIVHKYTNELYSELNDHVENVIKESADIQKELQICLADMIVFDEVASKSLTRTITKVSSDTVKKLISGNYYSDGKTLSKRLWKITNQNAKDIDNLIKINIAKGSNARELAKELDKFINPNNRIIAKNFKAGIDGHKISYQAQRLARTSITHASTEVLIENAKRNPFSKKIVWNLSPSHSARMHGKTDICDKYNQKSFDPERVPLQHCNCLCYFTEEIEDLSKCIEIMNGWSNGTIKNSKIDEWVYGAA